MHCKDAVKDSVLSLDTLMTVPVTAWYATALCHRHTFVKPHKCMCTGKSRQRLQAVTLCCWAAFNSSMKSCSESSETRTALLPAFSSACDLTQSVQVHSAHYCIALLKCTQYRFTVHTTVLQYCIVKITGSLCTLLYCTTVLYTQASTYP